jgi:phosphoribosylamine---glycine ligase
VVGPEVPLVAGVVDVFRAAGRRIVGPEPRSRATRGQQGLLQELSGCERNIPTAAFVTVENEADARKALDRFGFPVVLKADGLAAGKGVVVAQDRAQAEEALATLRGRLVIEEFLRGEEVSFIALCDGRDVVPLAATQDHKAVYDGDRGPNTGGMGAYCDAAILIAARRKNSQPVIYPTVAATGFTGFLYAGMMMTAEGRRCSSSTCGWAIRRRSL